jgi:hypothetical protein
LSMFDIRPRNRSVSEVNGPALLTMTILRADFRR